MIDKVKLSRRFSKGAKDYDSYANVQKIMGRGLIESIGDIEVESILEIGCGTGYVTQLIRERYKSASIDAIDIAPGMIDYAKKRLDDDSINFICGDIEAMDIKDKYDLIISNATFQWFNDLDNTIKKLMKSLNPTGILIFSTFGVDTFCELKECYEKVCRNLETEIIRPSQRFISEDELKDILGHRYSIKDSYEPEHFKDCMDFFMSVKKIGANNSTKKRAKASPAFMKKVIETYNRDYRNEEDMVRATYHTMIVRVENN